MVYRFGPFDFDPTSGRLYRGAQRVPLSDRYAAILSTLVTRAREVVPRDVLIAAGWRQSAVTDNSLDQAIARLRKVLAGGRRDARYIDTVPNRGYRFAEPVTRAERRAADDEPLDEHLAPFRAFVQGRTALDTLNRDAIGRARRAFADALRLAPDYGPAHVGLAMACGLAFEATRFDAVRDAPALEAAINHARTGIALEPASGEAWSTLAFVLYLKGATTEAGAAACKALALEPDDWRHALRLGYVSWGEERLRAARTTLTLCPGLALAYWLMATVFIARGAFDAALDVLRRGCAAQDAQSSQTAGYPAVGLHLLHGLVRAAQGREAEAMAELSRELSAASSGQLYGRECEANTWYAIGALHLRGRRHADAERAFRQALSVAPGHVFAAAALHTEPRSAASADLRDMDAAVARAIALARAGRHHDAARVYRDALAAAPSPAAGWLLPVEPVLDAAARPEIWSAALALVRERAA